MKKTGKILALLLVSLFLISFAVTIVSAVDPPTAASDAKAKATSGLEDIQTWVKSKLSSTTTITDQTKTTVARVLLTILVILLVYSVVNFIPILKANPAIGVWVSIIVGILSFMFIDASTILYILTNYEALGITLTVFLPLVIIIAFTIQLRKAEPSMAIFLNKLIIIFYIAYLGIRWVTLQVVGAKPPIYYAYLVAMLIAVIWLFIERRISNRMFLNTLLGDMDSHKTMDLIQIEAEINKLEESKRYASPSLVPMIDQRIKDLKKLMKHT